MLEESTQATVLPIPAPRRRSWLLRIFFLLLIALVVASSVVFFYLQPPASTSYPQTVEIAPGTSVKDITQRIEEAGIVRSKTVFYFILTLFYEPTDIKASLYRFDTPLKATEVAKRLVAGDFETNLVRFTHYEGERATHIAKNAKVVLQDFDEARFLEEAVPFEGKLYPNTYFVPKDFSAEALIALMLETYKTETEPLQTAMASHPLLTESEILTLASIIEREANTLESMKIISGILQGRMEAGMPLQADASIEYILDKPLRELTAEDLKIDSPYNTYTNRGLPPTPIGNPGKDAILAVLEPTPTSYVYYITDNDGVFHYATTYDEHLSNVNRYLR